MHQNKTLFMIVTTPKHGFDEKIPHRIAWREPSYAHIAVFCPKRWGWGQPQTIPCVLLEHRGTAARLTFEKVVILTQFIQETGRTSTKEL